MAGGRKATATLGPMHLALPASHPCMVTPVALRPLWQPWKQTHRKATCQGCGQGRRSQAGAWLGTVPGLPALPCVDNVGAGTAVSEAESGVLKVCGEPPECLLLYTTTLPRGSFIWDIQRRVSEQVREQSHAQIHFPNAHSCWDWVPGWGLQRGARSSTTPHHTGRHGCAPLPAPGSALARTRTLRCCNMDRDCLGHPVGSAHYDLQTGKCNPSRPCSLARSGSSSQRGLGAPSSTGGNSSSPAQSLQRWRNVRTAPVRSRWRRKRTCN